MRCCFILIVLAAALPVARAAAHGNATAVCGGHGTKGDDGVCVCEAGFELEGEECHEHHEDEDTHMDEHKDEHDDHDDHAVEGAECQGHGTKGADGVCVCEAPYELHGDECHEDHGDEDVHADDESSASAFALRSAAAVLALCGAAFAM